MSTGKLERLRFIDCMLANYGQINRKVIADYFGLSAQQVSHDIAEYMRNAPDNMTYDLSAKTYRATAQYERIFV